MARFVLLLFLLLPLAEIAMFIVVGRSLGVWMTLGLVVLGAIIGGLLLRQQGLGVITRMRASVDGGVMPGRTIFDATLIGMAAVLLILPGFISDIVALALLLPMVRGFFFTALLRRTESMETTATYRYRKGPDQAPGAPPLLDGLNDNERPGPRQ